MAGSAAKAVGVGRDVSIAVFVGTGVAVEMVVAEAIAVICVGTAVGLAVCVGSAVGAGTNDAGSAQAALIPIRNIAAILISGQMSSLFFHKAISGAITFSFLYSQRA
jgi:hypothetical protein